VTREPARGYGATSDQKTSTSKSPEAAAAAAALVARPEHDGHPAAGAFGGSRAGRGRPAADRSAVVSQAVLRNIIDALADGVALTDQDGTLVLASRRLEEMFGYGHGELAGQPVDSLVPVDLRESHRQDRAGYARAPRSRPMGAGAPLVGLRADGTTFPVTVSLSPVPTATSQLALAVVRDNAGTPGGDLLDLARRAAAAEQADASRDLLDQVVTGLFDVGVSLQAAAGLPHHTARQLIIDALQRLDDTIHEIRDHVFAAFGHRDTPAPPGGIR
jgi:PAS domain S-box-containing protein